MSNTSMDRDVLETFMALCQRAATPFAYKLSLMAARGEWVELLRCKVRIGEYTCPETLLLDLQCYSFLKKWPGLPTGVDLESVAVATFWSSEHQCYTSNEHLSPLLFDLGHYGEAPARLIREWRKEVRSLLGRVPTLAELEPRFGPGATFANRGDAVTVAHKLEDSYTLTRRARFVLSDWDNTAWSRLAAAGCVTSEGDHEDLVTHIWPDFAPRCEEYVRGNRFTTVPKDAFKHRGICVEPSINLYYQLGVGAWISDRLGKWGFSKERAKPYHQLLARLGSITGAVATIDLSNASDTICTNLVKLVLPEPWFRLLNELRSHYTFLKGSWVKLEKFSSMGNGFTFELETLLFWGLARALATVENADPRTWTCPGEVISVFGDDIIVPTPLAHLTCKALDFFGFLLNKEKTFVDGWFRESCGGDFWRGLDVRPFHLTKTLSEPAHVISALNGIRRTRDRLGLFGLDVLYPVWNGLLKLLPRRIRKMRGPTELGDLLIHDAPEYWGMANTIRVRNSRRYFTVWRPIPNRKRSWDEFRPGVVNAVALYGIPDGSSGDQQSRDPYRLAGGWRPRVNGSFVSGYKIGRAQYN